MAKRAFQNILTQSKPVSGAVSPKLRLMRIDALFKAGLAMRGANPQKGLDLAFHLLLEKSMKNIWNPKDCETILARINTLTANTQPLWGKISVGQMLAHCNVTLCP